MNIVPPGNIGPRTLLGLSAAVLLAHLTILQMTLLPSPHGPVLVSAFITRNIAPVVPAPPAVLPPTQHSTVQATAQRRLAPPVESAATDAPPLTDAPAPAQPMTARHDALASGGPPATELPPEPASAVAMVASAPGSMRIKYRVFSNRFPYRLSAELRWQNSGESYEARLELGALGLARAQTSRGLLTAQGLAPTRFSDKYRSEVAAHFNREQGIVTFSANTPDVPLQAGAQDRLSVSLQLASMLASAPARYPAHTLIGMQTVGPRDADTWVFTVLGEEQLVLPGGELLAVRLVRNPREPFDQKVELWLAPGLGYLPARIKITEPNGDFIDQQWLASEPLQ